MQTVLAFLLVLGAACAQFFQPIVSPVTFTVQPPGFQGGFQQGLGSKRSIGHRAVILNSEFESQLPQHLLNPFYKNPRLSAILAKESWFANGEQEVKNREAEKIPRMKIYSILKNAGLV